MPAAATSRGPSTPDGVASADHAASPVDGDGSDEIDRDEHPLTAARRELLERFERASGASEHEVRLVDAQAIRAIAHEARQRVIDVLYSEQRPYTATQLAHLTGLSPSAMSYHLRALERWGVVERAPEADDARSRPWRAGGTSITVTGDGAAVEAAQDVLFANTMAALRRRMRLLRRLPANQRARYVGLAGGELWLTDEQAEQFALVTERAAVELVESGWVNEPGPGRTRMAFVWSLLPDPFPSEEPPPASGDRPD